jgi:hypothetical protein
MRQRINQVAGTCTVNGVPERWEEIQAWADRLGLECRGEGLPGTAQTLVKRSSERVYLDGEQKAELLEQ